MGIILKQSLNNTIITYLGFGIGAVNVMFLYTNFMSDAYYGLINVILSASAVLMPLLAFGVPNALVKFYSAFEKERSKDGFLTLMLFLPLVLIFPIGLLTYLANETIGNFLSKENPMVKGYVWYIFLIGMAMAYFEVFYAWARIRLKSVFGNFMKEIFCRAGQTLLLLLLYWDVITISFFLKALVGFYLARTVIMKMYAFRLRMPKISFDWPQNTTYIIKYSALIILGGSTAIVLLEVDKVMLNQFIKIENVAYYSVASFMAMAIAVPTRSMHQITYPLTAELLNKNDLSSLKSLYHKSSLTLFIISGLLFILLLLNLEDIYQLLPTSYRDGIVIVFWIGLAKLYDAMMGNNNAILYNSDYYVSVLLMGVLLAILTVFFNLWLIPKYGLDGAAYASFAAFFIYNTIKLVFVRWKYNMYPFTLDTFRVLALLLLTVSLFYYLQFPFHPLVNIAIKSLLMTALYLGVLFRFKISEDVIGVLSKFFNRKG